jgi:hypothetical protein
MPQFIRKRNLAGAVVVVLLLAAGGAYAYWTAGGSGSGSAATADGTSELVVNQNTVVTAMYPGDSAQVISGDFDNGNSGPIRVNTVTASISSVDKAIGAPAGTCDATDFTLGSAVMTVNSEIAIGTGQGAWTGATLKFNNKNANQDACKGATVNLSYLIA